MGSNNILKGIEMTECPWCKNSHTYYDKNIVRYDQHYLFKNNDPEMSSEQTHIRGGKKFFCGECHKEITKYIKSLD